MRIKLKPGNILAFRSNLLVHGNLPCSGIRHSLVFFTHNNLFPETFQHIEKRKLNVITNKTKKKRKNNNK